MTRDQKVYIDELLVRVVEGFKSLLGDNLFGIYLHGSLAMGAFHPSTSDIDFLVVVHKPLDKETKQRVADFLVDLSEGVARNDLEMSIVLRKYLNRFEYPTPYEFHFGKDLIPKFRTGEVDLESPKTDKDLAAHFVITRERGKALYGPLARDVFPEVPASDYLDSLMYDVESYRGNMLSMPIYAILNLCRVLAYVQDQLITSKREGGEWALVHVEGRYRPLIKRALSKYESEAPVQRPWDEVELNEFSEYMLARINATPVDDLDED